MSEEVGDRLTKRRRLFSYIAISIFLICCFSYLVYWLGWGRFQEETNDAYVNGNMIMVTPQIDGIITMILADNTQLVEEGQSLIELDRHDYEIALEKSKANLADKVRQVVQLFLKVAELGASFEARQAEFLKASLDFKHRKALVDDGAVTKEDFEHSETSFLAAYATVKEAEEMLNAAYAEVRDTTIKTHPLVEQAKANLKEAFLKLHRCTVFSPARGILTQRKAQVGEYVQAQDPLLAVVPLDQIWVDANFREIQLKNLRIGQSVKMISDMYGAHVEFHGNLIGLNPGTGSIFSILPPQNATGNWIKIIQRIPVKIAFKQEELKNNPLVLGLSMTVTVNTHDNTGKQLPSDASVLPLYQTTIYEKELQGVEDLMDQIISENSFDDSN